MSAQPVDPKPDDLAEILRVLPEECHAQFITEYAAAVDGARRPERFCRLQELLRLWRLRAVAYSSAGYEMRLANARQGHPADFVPADQLIPGWHGGDMRR